MPFKPKTALAVDDEPTDLEKLRQVLTDAGFEVLTASDAKTAIDIFQAHPDGIDLLVTDVAMTPISGPDLAEQLVSLNPSLYVIFVSAYSGSLSFGYSEASPHFAFDFLAKPFSAEELLEKVRSKTEKVRSAGSVSAPSFMQ